MSKGELPHTELEAAYAAERKRIAELHETDGDLLHPVFGEGMFAPLLMLLGEAPGAEEAKQGHPFVGKAGKQLDALLISAGIRRSEVFITNTVKYRPTKSEGRANRPPLSSEVKAALPLLQKELALVQPSVIATLGNTPLKAMLWLSCSEAQLIGAVHGRAQTVLVGGRQITLFPLYHPASVIYNPALKTVLGEDISTLARLLEGRK